jgi:hypothetical protein
MDHKDIKSEDTEEKPSSFVGSLDDFVFKPSSDYSSLRLKKEENCDGVLHSVSNLKRPVKSTPESHSRYKLRSRKEYIDIDKDFWKSEQPEKKAKLDPRAAAGSLELLRKSEHSADVPDSEPHISTRRPAPQAAPRRNPPSRKARGYAAPDTYAHLNSVPDRLGLELDGMARNLSFHVFFPKLTDCSVLFCGIKCVYFLQ